MTLLDALAGIYVFVARLAADPGEAVGALLAGFVGISTVGACPAFVADARPVAASAAPVAAARRVLIALLVAPT